ncbi:MAG: hypothetical protein JRJ42_00930 [Deltaproteobacteria bacterium]|nr:hypothetical protein [Deltaproteobacteria bacterium]MBW2019076.1 hypothetical protein [Deltaproteobacteria bacterium]MBW2073533.1 hypothetical protein [Deltaproteobacteria bacterium]
MPQCKKCGKKGLFLKIENDTGLCLSCNGSFAQEGKILTEKIMEAKNKAAAANNPDEIAASCKAVEHYGNELIALHQTYNLQPSQALLDLIETHKKMRESAQK